MGLPSKSLDPAPFNVTVAPRGTVWSGPAFATGGRLGTTAVAFTANWRKLF